MLNVFNLWYLTPSEWSKAISPTREPKSSRQTLSYLSYPDLLFLSYSFSGFMNPDCREETLNCRDPDTLAVMFSNVHILMIY